MSTYSEIEWTEQTWNPVTGCIKISPGCKHCYAETLARRLRAIGARGYEHGFDRVSLLYERLEQPLKRRKPTVYFVNSMSDLFQEAVPFSFVNQVMEIVAATPQHTYQILTKRAERMQEYFRARKVPDNAWLGVSVEDQKYGKPRIPVLRQIEAKTRFLSVEPLLEDLGELDLTSIHWVIVGGESGRDARQMQKAWVENVKHQSEAAGAAFFFKQWGAWGEDGVRRNKKRNGRSLEGRVYDLYPRISAVQAPPRMRY